MIDSSSINRGKSPTLTTCTTHFIDAGTTQFSPSRSPAQHVQLVTELVQTMYFQGQIQDLIRGAPDHDRPKLLMVHSSVVQAKWALFSMGSGAHLRPLEALGYFITKYAFSLFWGTFLYYF